MPTLTRRPRPHGTLTLAFSSLLFGLFVQSLLPPHSPSLLPATAPAPVQQLCRFAAVSFRPSPTCRHGVGTPRTATLCHWQISVTSAIRPHPHSLSLAPHAHPAHLLVAERALLLRVAPCTSPATCNATAACTYSPEDPSDALWLRAYATSSKFVVLFNIGLTSLFFFIAAILADGSIFHPHRPGLADASASTLIMLALASLLYVLVVPHRLQFALLGNGSFDSIAFIFIVLLIAVLLPALAVVWLSTTVFLVFMFGFLFEYTILLLLATVHFMAVLLLYQAQNTLLHVRLIYLSHPDEDDAAHSDERLLTIGTRFLSRVRANWFVTRVPQVLEERAFQVVQNNLPDHISDQLLRDFVPAIPFDDLHSDSTSSILPITPPSPSQPPPALPEGSDPATPHANSTEVTPLLRTETPSPVP